MKTEKILFYSFLSSAGVIVYVCLVGWLMINGEKLFGQLAGVTGIIAFLLLFVVSTAITGLLFLGGPVYLYLEKNKKIAAKLLFYNLFWLGLATIVFFVVLYWR